MTREEAIKWQEAFRKTYGNFPPEATEACDMAIEALKEPEQKWIPVSERLPEEPKYYEVTVDFGSEQITEVVFYSICESRWGAYNNDITAWRERLQEPYKAGEQE